MLYNVVSNLKKIKIKKMEQHSLKIISPKQGSDITRMQEITQKTIEIMENGYD